MWFGNRREPVTQPATEPEHWPTERMINEGHSDIATPEDLEGLDGQALYAIADICEVTTAAPDECIPCLAYAKIMDAEAEAARKRLEEMTPPTPAAIEPGSLEVTYEPEPSEISARHVLSGRLYPFPEEKPVVERFAEQVRGLQELVSELLEGPPIPPPGVTQHELALLVVAAQRWIRITDAQGVALANDQQHILDATKTLVARLHHG